MTFIGKITVTITLALAFLEPAHLAQASEKVVFSAPSIQPTPFRAKKAAAKGITLTATPGPEFVGYLSKPDGAGPFPAVVILESAGGLLASHNKWAETLASWGYASLLVDSFGSRDGTNFTDTKAVDMTIDAYAAYNYLAARGDIDASKIGVLGFSMGGSFLFTVLRDSNGQRPENVDFKTGVAFYPTCDLGYNYTKSILILFGRDDTLTSLSQCQKLLNASKAAGGGISMHVYDGATHFFDSTDYAKDAVLHGDHWRKPLWYNLHEFNANAYADSVNRARAFLDAHLK